VFYTLADVEISSSDKNAEVSAIHAQWVDYQSIGKASGQSGLTLTLPRTPLIAKGQGREDIFLAVEVSEDSDLGSYRAVKHNGRNYRIWDEVESFSGCESHDCVYRLDRVSGQIQFAPSLHSTHAREHGQSSFTGRVALAAIPEAGKDIIAKYRVGGGEKGNLPGGVLTKIKDQTRDLNAIDVTNPVRATGGAEQESLKNALTRGPLELNSLQRVVTAQDFELFATKKSGINRSCAYTKRSRWLYATPGTVGVVIVPQVSGDQGSITPAVMHQNENTNLMTEIIDELNLRKPLGTTCQVSWCQYKSVTVEVALTVYREEDRIQVKQRIEKRLNDLICPLNTEGNNQFGWRFGQSLGAYDVYRILSDEPGVKTVEPVILKVKNAPNKNCQNIEADSWQPDTWYAASESQLYRTINNGEGWEMMIELTNERILGVKSFPKHKQIVSSVAGLLAMWTRSEKSFRLYVSHDCGETWVALKTLSSSDSSPWKINDIAWIERNGIPSLLVATSRGLYEDNLKPGTEWEQRLIKVDDQSLPTRSVVVVTNSQGKNRVAVLTTRDEGVFLSSGVIGEDSGFKSIGLKRKPVEVLGVQYGDTQRFLWAGLFASGNDPGEGCERLELRDTGGENEQDWKSYSTGWKGRGNDRHEPPGAGACTSLSFAGNDRVFVGTSRHGVLTIQVMGDNPSWSQVNFHNGLPAYTENGIVAFETITGVASKDDGDGLIIMCSGKEGVFKSRDGGDNYQRCCKKVFNDKVTLPPTWLFCSAEHSVSVEYD